MIEKKDVKQAIKEAFDEEIKPLYVEREQHWMDHLKIQKLEDTDILFLKEWREWFGKIKSTTTQTIVRVLVTGFIVLIILGIGVWVKIKHFTH